MHAGPTFAVGNAIRSVHSSSLLLQKVILTCCYWRTTPKSHAASYSTHQLDFAAFERCLLTVLTTSSTLCCHCLPSGLFQAMTLSDCTVTSPGVKSPFEEKSHRSAASGHCTARELQAHTAWPHGNGEPIFLRARLLISACQLCTRPSLHSSCLTQCTCLTEPRVTRSGCQPQRPLASQSHSASRCGAPSLMLGCLVWMRLASPHGGQPCPNKVLWLTVALHLCPQRPHLQAALVLLVAATVSGVLSPLRSQSHSAATSGWLWARSLQGQTALPLSWGQPLPCDRLLTDACHLCGCPVLHQPLLHQTFLWLWGAIVMLPRWALAFWSHSCCRCGASLLMSGPACS